jgi:hypothetical protein
MFRRGVKTLKAISIQDNPLRQYVSRRALPHIKSTAGDFAAASHCAEQPQRRPGWWSEFLVPSRYVWSGHHRAPDHGYDADREDKRKFRHRTCLGCGGGDEHGVSVTTWGI